MHLTNQAIHQLQILPGKTQLLAAWTLRNRVFYFDLESGVPMGERTIDEVSVPDRKDARWQEFINSLVAPNKAVLPLVSTHFGNLHLSGDGRIRVYDCGKGELTLVAQEKETKLHAYPANRFIRVSLDRFLGLVGALDEQGKLHLYQQDQPVGAFDINLRLRADLPAQLAIPQGGGAIYVTDGQQIVVVSPEGQVRQRFLAHYSIGQMVCSPNGRLLLTCDYETNVLRVYNSSDLLGTRQRHAVDLLARATQVQLIADLPPVKAAVGALAMNNQGVVTFAMSGVICVTDLSEMDVLPKPQKLI
ncbi:MAG: hypothetical protein K8L99_30175 [Anaerolineae bacterium]|nr:hypothetical protein [Anaerolineae bacterium]